MMYKREKQEGQDKFMITRKDLLRLRDNFSNVSFSLPDTPWHVDLKDIVELASQRLDDRAATLDLAAMEDQFDNSEHPDAQDLDDLMCLARIGQFVLTGTLQSE